MAGKPVHDMKINVFEGARRVAKIVTWLWIAACGAYLWIEKPAARVTYSVEHLGAPARLSDSDCTSDDAREWIHTELDDGTPVGVILCFRASRADNGEMLVPYARNEAQPEIVWMGRPFSAEVSNYTDDYQASFSLPPRDEATLRSAWWTALYEHVKRASLAAMIGAILFWIFVSGVGWVVRGFLSIPRGQDFRP